MIPVQYWRKHHLFRLQKRRVYEGRMKIKSICSVGIKNILYLYLNMILLIYFNVKKHQIRKENPLTKEIEASNIQK